MKSIISILESARRNNSGATLKNWEPVKYPAGFQYSKTENGETNVTADIQEAAAMVKALKGTCGVWFDKGLFYIETSYWTSSRQFAVNVGKMFHQKSIYDWANDTYIEL